MMDEKREEGRVRKKGIIRFVGEGGPGREKRL